MDTLSYPTPPPAKAVTPGATLLLVFGVVLIMVGGIVAFVGLAAPVAIVLTAPSTPRSRPPDIRAAMPTAMLLVTIGSGIVTVGVGSIRQRRWVRPVVMSFSGMLAGWGMITLIVMTLLYVSSVLFFPSDAAPVTRRGAAPAPLMSDALQTMIEIATLVIFGVAAPLAFFFAYRKRTVAMALDQADPRMGWSDRCPIPVFALMMGLLSLVFFAMILAISVLLVQAPPPSPGTLDRRIMIHLCLILLSVLLVVAAGLVYHQNRAGPWIALLLIVLIAAAMVMPMLLNARNDPFGGRRQIVQTFDFQWAMQAASVRGMVVIAAYLLPAAAYILYVRRWIDDARRQGAL